ncbi:MAG TPA: hypothetical protein DIW36_05450 [Ruminococcaceae bacterium]|nr:hypothetical protein [Oscillospiraceae bacterium]
MVANKIGESVEFEGVTYTVGASVSVNKTSDYAGLAGKITEIATDDDMDTDNDYIDIYCDFDEPTDPEVISKLEKRFSHIYGNPKTIQDICLDGIVMAPDEISLID